LAYIAHEIGIAAQRCAFYAKDDEYGYAQQVQHLSIFLYDEIVEHWFDQIEASRAGSCHQGHADHGQRNLSPIGQHKSDLTFIHVVQLKPSCWTSTAKGRRKTPEKPENKKTLRFGAPGVGSVSETALRIVQKIGKSPVHNSGRSIK
jgi:hypothetical protein